MESAACVAPSEDETGVRGGPLTPKIHMPLFTTYTIHIFYIHSTCQRSGKSWDATLKTKHYGGKKLPNISGHRYKTMYSHIYNPCSQTILHRTCALTPAPHLNHQPQSTHSLCWIGRAAERTSQDQVPKTQIPFWVWGNRPTPYFLIWGPRTPGQKHPFLGPTKAPFRK
jgi:hypothetical protein